MVHSFDRLIMHCDAIFKRKMNLTSCQSRKHFFPQHVKWEGTFMLCLIFFSKKYFKKKSMKDIIKKVIIKRLNRMKNNISYCCVWKERNIYFHHYLIKEIDIICNIISSGQNLGKVTLMLIFRLFF